MAGAGMPRSTRAGVRRIRRTVEAILNLHGARPRFTTMVGTGGIGHGSFFLLEGNASLGREESRAGRILDRRDYCKLHIISHYVKGLLGDACAVYPVGRVGEDDAGARLLNEMAAAGLDTRFARPVAGAPTLFSFCYFYPDGSGGNMTTADSASGLVDEEAVKEAEEVIARAGASGIALAVPEVPLAARVALLEAAGRHGLFRVASFTRAEMPAAREQGLLGMVDLLAVNLEEALAAAGLAPWYGVSAERVPASSTDSAPRSSAETADRRAGDAEEQARTAARKIISAYPGIRISITAGAAGSWSGGGQTPGADAARLTHQPALPVEVAGTSGAGDAHVAGLIAGLSAGLALSEAQVLGDLMGAASVTSPHTIHPGITRKMLAALLRLRPDPAPRLAALLDEPPSER
jgi:ribokinase